MTTSAGSPIADNQNSLTAGPRGPVHHYRKDGATRFTPNMPGDHDYEPNSFGGPTQDPSFAEPPLRISGDAARWDHRVGNDDYTQPGNLFCLFNDGEKQRLFDNIAAAMQGVPDEIVERQLARFSKCDPAYGAGVRKALGK